MLFVLFVEILLCLFITDYQNLVILICDCIILICFIFSYFSIIETNKTPIKWTNKLKRIYIIGLVILFALSITKFGASLVCIITVLLPIVCNFINIYDKIKNYHYIKQAQKKLSIIKPKIIAITGSNGKTSIKNILGYMLSDIGCYISPKSYNTPLGISKFINEQLPLDCKYLILEYGARKVGQIKQLCNLFGANYGVCSLVTTQHIETFKSIENVYLAKKELPDYLGNNFCVFNLDNDYTKKMFNLKQGAKVGVSITHPADIYAENIKIKNFKTYFTLNVNDKSYNCCTNLIGKHNVTNILLATAVALELKVPVEKIIDCIANLKYTPHRLEYIKGKINILDDSYNCSIESAKESLYALSQTENKKMVCTPGIIEGGELEHTLNVALGKMCACCDYVVIVGNHNKEAIKQGLKSENFNMQNVICSPTLEDAKKCFTLLSENDTLLLLNDLPDDYN